MKDIPNCGLLNSENGGRLNLLYIIARHSKFITELSMHSTDIYISSPYKSLLGGGGSGHLHLAKIRLLFHEIKYATNFGISFHYRQKTSSCTSYKFIENWRKPKYQFSTAYVGALISIRLFLAADGWFAAQQTDFFLDGLKNLEQ
jgi:hypothetical protein